MSNQKQKPEYWKEALKKIGEDLEQKEQPKPIKTNMDRTPEEKLKNSIGMQMMFYTHSGASMEDTIDRIYRNAIKYTKEDIKCKCTSEQKTGTTSIDCCNQCGKATEEFWTNKQPI